MRDAVEMDPEYGPALVHLGMALYARRNYEDAVTNLEKGLALIGDRARGPFIYGRPGPYQQGTARMRWPIPGCARRWKKTRPANRPWPACVSVPANKRPIPSRRHPEIWPDP